MSIWCERAPGIIQASLNELTKCGALRGFSECSENPELEIGYGTIYQCMSIDRSDSSIMWFLQSSVPSWIVKWTERALFYPSPDVVRVSRDADCNDVFNVHLGDVYMVDAGTNLGLISGTGLDDHNTVTVVWSDKAKGQIGLQSSSPIGDVTQLHLGCFRDTVKCFEHVGVERELRGSSIVVCNPDDEAHLSIKIQDIATSEAMPRGLCSVINGGWCSFNTAATCDYGILQIKTDIRWGANPMMDSAEQRDAVEGPIELQKILGTR